MTSLGTLQWIYHGRYEIRPCPLAHCSDKHEQVRFKLNTMDFTFPIIFSY